MSKIKFPKEVTNFLNEHVAVTYEDGEKWSYIPLWYKHTQQEDVFEVFNFENLPDEFKQHVSELWRELREKRK